MVSAAHNIHVATYLSKRIGLLHHDPRSFTSVVMRPTVVVGHREVVPHRHSGMPEVASAELKEVSPALVLRPAAVVLHLRDIERRQKPLVVGLRALRTVL